MNKEYYLVEYFENIKQRKPRGRELILAEGLTDAAHQAEQMHEGIFKLWMSDERKSKRELIAKGVCIMSPWYLVTTDSWGQYADYRQLKTSELATEREKCKANVHYGTITDFITALHLTQD